MAPLHVLASLLAASALPAADAQSDRATKATLASAPYRAAVAQLDREHDRIVADIVTLTEIPAPPFKEAKRALAY
ncbi:MAG: peptidase M20, partial [Tsuneonella sp.]